MGPSPARKQKILCAFLEKRLQTAVTRLLGRVVAPLSYTTGGIRKMGADDFLTALYYIPFLGVSFSGITAT